MWLYEDIGGFTDILVSITVMPSSAGIIFSSSGDSEATSFSRLVFLAFKDSISATKYENLSFNS